MSKVPRRSLPRPTLRFSPYAWAKLRYLRDAGPTEIGGFGVALSSDLLRVDDIVLPRQECSVVTVAFDDLAVADYFDEQVDLGRRPEAFARIWVHTHPGTSALPSTTDEATWQRVFGPCDWAVMFILARGGQRYARLRCRLGAEFEMPLRVEVDYSAVFAASDPAAWQAEYERQVEALELLPSAAATSRRWHRATATDRPTSLFEDVDETDLPTAAEYAEFHDPFFVDDGMSSPGRDWADPFTIEPEPTQESCLTDFNDSPASSPTSA